MCYSVDEVFFETIECSSLFYPLNIKKKRTFFLQHRIKRTKQNKKESSSLLRFLKIEKSNIESSEKPKKKILCDLNFHFDFSETKKTHKKTEKKTSQEKATF